MGRDKEYFLSEEVKQNITKHLNQFRNIYGIPMYVSSGWRPAEINVKITTAAKRSNHILGLACDFVDDLGVLDKFCLSNPEVLEYCGLYQEHPAYTKGCYHLQC
jgi:hypothetical protein